MHPSQHHILIVNFTTTSETQNLALQQVGDNVADFLSQQAGFVSSGLHASLDGNSLLHYAEWNSAADFQAAAKIARSHPDLPVLLAYEPSASTYTLRRSFPEG